MILYVKNRRFYKSAVIGIVFGIVLVWLFIWNVMNVINISIRYDGDRNYAFVTTGQTVYTRMKDEDYVKGTYRIFPKETVAGDSVYKKVQSDIVVVDFTVEDILGVTGALQRDDTDGCIISGELSYTLFGSSRTVGSIIKVFEKTYVVRSIVDSEESYIIVQAGQERGGDWEFVDSKTINGIVLDVSDENYRSEYADDVACHHGYGNSFYYVIDYLDILPDINLPSKWSDFDFWRDTCDELKSINERKLYSDKDVLEKSYYRCSQKLKRYRLRSGIFVFILFVWMIMICRFIRENIKK